MTKKELIQQAETLGIEISDPKHTTVAQIEQMISEASEQTETPEVQAETETPEVQAETETPEVQAETENASQTSSVLSPTVVNSDHYKTYQRTKSRDIKPTVMSWFDELGTPDAVNKAEFSEFMQRVLAVCPHWVKRDDENTAKKHFSWYKSTWKKQYKLVNSAPAESEETAEAPDLELATV